MGHTVELAIPFPTPAIEAGSVSPWEPGGISPFQFARGRESAEAVSRPYDSYGVLPPVA
jgi:hypothetical protein